MYDYLEKTGPGRGVVGLAAGRGPGVEARGPTWPSSCKGRGICPACIVRRMSDTAAHLVDRVLPEAPMRQWDAANKRNINADDKLKVIFVAKSHLS